MAVLEGGQLGDDARIGVEHTGEIHHLGQSDHLGVVAEGQEIVDFELGPGGLERGRRHAGTEIDPNVHDRLFRRGEEIGDAFGTGDIGDLVRVANDGGNAVAQDAAVEFERGDQRGFDVQMGIDEAGYGKASPAIDCLVALILAVRTDDPVRHHSDIGFGDVPGDDVEPPDIADDEVGGLQAAPGPDHSDKRFTGRGDHADSFRQMVEGNCRHAHVRSRLAMPGTKKLGRGALAPKLNVVLRRLARGDVRDVLERLAQHFRLHFGREDLALEAHDAHAMQEALLVG